MAIKEHLSEKIRYLVDLFRLFWILEIALGGGTIGLFLGEKTPLRVVLATGGVALILTFAEFLRRLDIKIRELIEKLKEV